MKKTLVAAAMAIVAAACGSTTNNPDAGTPDAGTHDFSTANKIFDFYDGKTLTMTGSDIPSDPLGFSSSVNYGVYTPCYNKILLGVVGGTTQSFAVTTTYGTFTAGGDGGLYQAGHCDTASPTTTAPTTTSNTVAITNITNNGGCFDITISYTGATQDGRGMISADGKTMTLELYNSGKAVNIHCADGAVGASGVQLVVGTSNVPFSGNAKQVYRLP